MDFNYTIEPGKTVLTQKPDRAEKPLVSIITPYYNAGEYFEQTFHCVLNQTFPWYEWIIVDDGSTDQKSVEVLENLAKCDDRIRLVYQPNGGLSSARNTGFQQSTTEIIITLDADDLIEPVYLEQLYFALLFHPKAGWAYTNTVGFGEAEYKWDKSFSAITMKTENLLVATAAIRKKVHEKVGGYLVSKQKINEDWLFWLCAMGHSFYPVHTGGFLFWYRRKTTGLLCQTRNDPEAVEYNRKLINEASKQVDQDLKAIEYPGKEVEIIDGPRNLRWVRKVNHEKSQLLEFRSHIRKDELTCDTCFEDKTFERVLITISFDDYGKQKPFYKYIKGVFCLPEFIDPDHWAEFVSYVIQSREVDVVFLNDSDYGYLILPWLKREYPQLITVEYIDETNNLFNGKAIFTHLFQMTSPDLTFAYSERIKDHLVRNKLRDEKKVEVLPSISQKDHGGIPTEQWQLIAKRLDIMVREKKTKYYREMQENGADAAVKDSYMRYDYGLILTNIFWEDKAVWMEKQLIASRMENDEKQTYVLELLKAKEYLIEQVEKKEKARENAENVAKELKNWVGKLEANLSWSEEERKKILQEKQTYIEELLKAKEFLAEQVENKEKARENAEEVAKELKNWVGKLEADLKWNEEEREKSLQEKQTYIEELLKAKEYLAEQVENKEKARENAEKVVTELREWIQQLEEAKTYLEKQWQIEKAGRERLERLLQEQGRNT